MILTCSNDETVKLWSADLEPIQTLRGHSAFVFSAKSLRLGSYASGGEDKTLRIWGESDCTQDIQLPAAIWSVAFDQLGDIFTACTDGFIRIFSADPVRKADPDVQAIFDK